ncbi:MAG: hypothetical protein ABIU54_11125 [Candidatus Eisenbacteria bacterium]
MPMRYAFVLLVVTLVVTCRSAAAAPTPRPQGAGPALAVEDTMHTEVTGVLVTAPRILLDEILDRVARGEARRESLMTEQAFTATLRVVRNATSAKPEVLMETVSRVFKKKPGLARTVELRHYELKPNKDPDKRDVDVNFSSNMREEGLTFAFKPESRREYRYRIEARELLGDHLIYRIRFEPRSVLAVYEPSGLVWIDTKEYVIVRQELEFHRSPVPLFLKGIDRMVVERIKVGDHWVASRMLMRIRASVPLPKFGRAFDFALQFSDYSINSGLPDSIFAKPGTKRKGARS